MKTILGLGVCLFLAAVALTGCGNSSELATPADITEDEKAKAELEDLHVENEERLHFEQSNNK